MSISAASASPACRQISGFAREASRSATSFVGLSVDKPVGVPTVFSHHRERLLAGDIAAEFMAAVLNLPQMEGLL